MQVPLINNSSCTLTPSTTGASIAMTSSPYGDIAEAKASTPDLLAMGKITPMQVLRTLPESVILQETVKEQDIDHIENKCSAKVLVILMESHHMIESTTLSQFILNDSDFQHTSLPYIQTITPSFDSSGSDSSAAQSIRNYINLAKIIEKYYFEFDGFVIIANLGKLAYASSYLSFMLENLSKSVVFTSSTTGLEHAFNDAKTNLISSLIIAGRSNINEVCVCFDRCVYRGSRVIRHNQSSHEAFASPNLKQLAEFGTALVINKSLLLPPCKKGFRVFTKMYTDIMVLYITPCTSFMLLKYLLCNKKRMGIVLSIYGAGNAPQSRHLKSIFKAAIVDHKCNIVITTQCLKGHVNMTVYATGNFFSDVGLINGGDMTVEACVAKLSYLMGKGLSPSEVRTRFPISICGEVTPMHMIKGRIVDYKSVKGDHHGVDQFDDSD